MSRSKKIVIKIDQAKEARRASRVILGDGKAGKSGAHREHRRRIKEEEAEKEMQEGKDEELDETD